MQNKEPLSPAVRWEAKLKRSYITINFSLACQDEKISFVQKLQKFKSLKITIWQLTLWRPIQHRPSKIKCWNPGNPSCTFYDWICQCPDHQPTRLRKIILGSSLLNQNLKLQRYISTHLSLEFSYFQFFHFLLDRTLQVQPLSKIFGWTWYWMTPFKLSFP